MENENKSMIWVVIGVLLLAIVAIGGYALMRDDGVEESDNDAAVTENNDTDSNADDAAGTSEESQIDPGKMQTFDLNAQNNSNQTGSVVLEEVGDQLRVTISLASTDMTPQPAHIHMGKCPTPGDVVFPLENVVEGSSVTMLDTSLDELKAKGELAVNVHKSATESSVYVACGDLAL